MKRKIILPLLIVLMLSGCAKSEPAIVGKSAEVMEQALHAETTKKTGSKENTGNEDTEAGKSTDISIMDTALETPVSTPVPEETIITLGFAGDMNLDENWPTTLYLNQQVNGISDCISAEIIEDTNSCDLFMINNEYTYSNAGTPMNGKAYTFRAKPERVSILGELGVDIVLLANNHIYDYGKEAMLDTFNVLDSAQIDYVGAGRNIEEACKIVYYDIEGMKIAYVAASRAEKNKMTPQATESEPGILRAYDSARFLELVQEADANSDFVVANIHWGTEYSYDLEKVQKELGHALVEAGADAVIGTHPHVLQGIEIYEGTPIFYSLGNFWFNEKDLYSGYIKLSIKTSDSSLKEMQFIPCVQQNCATRVCANEQEKEEIFCFMEDISENILIEDDGKIVISQ